jgi:hypothetical protein
VFRAPTWCIRKHVEDILLRLGGLSCQQPRYYCCTTSVCTCIWSQEQQRFNHVGCGTSSYAPSEMLIKSSANILALQVFMHLRVALCLGGVQSLLGGGRVGIRVRLVCILGSGCSSRIDHNEESWFAWAVISAATSQLLAL